MTVCAHGGGDEFHGEPQDDRRLANWAFVKENLMELKRESDARAHKAPRSLSGENARRTIGGELEKEPIKEGPQSRTRSDSPN